MNLLPTGIEVSRTADDLLRHHYKFMVVDRRILYVLTFNYTHLDIEHSRSFGLAIDEPEYVEEAVRLFYADIRRQEYKPGIKNFIVSPANSREQLSHFIRGAEKQLLIYDPEISDRAMIRLLRDRARDGVEIRIIGRVKKASEDFDPGRMMRMRFHTRTILRDGCHGPPPSDRWALPFNRDFVRGGSGECQGSVRSRQRGSRFSANACGPSSWSG